MAPVPGAVNLLDRLRGAFPPGVILEASAQVCEDPYQTQRALEGIVPALLLALIQNFPGSSRLALLLNHQQTAGPALILGPASAGMTEWIAAETGLRRESALSLLSLAAPRIVDALRLVQSERNLGAAALDSVLAAHRPRVRRLLPESLAERLESWL